MSSSSSSPGSVSTLANIKRNPEQRRNTTMMKPLSKTDPSYNDIFSFTTFYNRAGVHDQGYPVHGYYDFYQ